MKSIWEIYEERFSPIVSEEELSIKRNSNTFWVFIGILIFFIVIIIFLEQIKKARIKINYPNKNFKNTN